MSESAACGGIGHTDNPRRIVPVRCDQELCPNWSGDGNVCPCAIFGLDRPSEVTDA